MFLNPHLRVGSLNLILTVVCCRFIGEILQETDPERSEEGRIGKGDIEQQCGYNRDLSPPSGRWRVRMLLLSWIVSLPQPITGKGCGLGRGSSLRLGAISREKCCWELGAGAGSSQYFWQHLFWRGNLKGAPRPALLFLPYSLKWMYVSECKSPHKSNSPGD